MINYDNQSEFNWCYFKYDFKIIRYVKELLLIFMSNQTLDISLKSSSRMKGFYSAIWLNVKEKQCKKFKSYRKIEHFTDKWMPKKFGFIWPQYISVNSSIRFKFASVAGGVVVYLSHVEQRQLIVLCFPLYRQCSSHIVTERGLN